MYTHCTHKHRARDSAAAFLDAVGLPHSFQHGIGLDMYTHTHTHTHTHTLHAVGLAHSFQHGITYIYIYIYSQEDFFLFKNSLKPPLF